MVLVRVNFGLTQPANDNCENAIDITPYVFQQDSFFICGPGGLAFDAHGYAYGSLSNATLDPMMYNSQECQGVLSETTASYPDIWFKSTLNSSSIVVQKILFYGQDSLQLAIYYGQCGSLFQSQCFTSGSEIDYVSAELYSYPHNSSDDIYFQVKSPPHSTWFVGLCFTEDISYLHLVFQFSYDRPASTILTSIENDSKKAGELFIYPNPSQDMIYMHSYERIYAVEIFNQLGQVLKHNDTSQAIDVSDFAPGLYYLKAYTSSGISTSSWIKK